MRVPLQITFRNMDRSDAVEANIRDRVEKLEAMYDGIMGCRVVVEADHRHHHKGNLYHVRIDLTVPGGELVASRKSHKNHAHEDIYVAVRDAAEATRRQLEAFVRKRRGQVKEHDVPPHGRISQLVPEQEFGRIETPDGREIYFHRNSVVDEDFDKLEVGTEVRFAEEPGDEGPQASTVVVLGKHHILG